MDTTTNIPLIMYQPQNILVLLTFYSPLIIAVCVLSMSFIFQNFNGFIYLGFFIAVSVLREFILMISGVTSTANATASICSSVQYSKFGNSGFSVFAIAFTILYLCLPMFLNKDVNYVVFGILLAYLLLDIGIRSYKQCISKIDILFFGFTTKPLHNRSLLTRFFYWFLNMGFYNNRHSCCSFNRHCSSLWLFIRINKP